LKKNKEASLHIGINALYLLPGKVGGAETYTRNLVRWLTTLDSRNKYSIFINKESTGIFESLAPGITVVPCPIRATSRPIRILWEQFVLPFQVRARKIDVLLSTGLTSPIFCPAKSVLVLYDLQHINQPHNFHSMYLLFLKSIIYASAKSADGIITISNHVKNDIVKFYRIAPERIAVSHLGVDRELFNDHRPPLTSAIKERYGLPERYLLYAAASLPHKNHARLFEALVHAKKQIPELKLLLIGARDKGEDALVRKIRELGLENDVILLGWVPFEDVPLIYQGCEAFVFPTLHEGFGLPVIEAMACGVPVICSHMEPLIEVAGDAALFVNPLDSKAIANGIVSLLQSQEMRAELVAKGYRRAQEFGWENTARTTLDFVGTISGAPRCLPERERGS
jgi:glycosyltransferase involved in cell wall biosynthesis